MLFLTIAFGLLLAQQPEPVYINAPYIPSSEKVVSAMLKLAGVNKGDVVYDLGCGDGRIVILAAKEYGAHGTGIDLNPKRIEEARANARKAGVDALVKFEVNDLFAADIHSATVITLYLLTDVNLRLRPKLLKDLKPGTRVVSNSFGMGDWKAERELIVDGNHIYLWTIPPR
jgi:ubiquinone/menaquinone biosynthesis C-methylase UbiE